MLRPILALALAVSAAAQPAGAPPQGRSLYDSSKEQTLQGTVGSVQTETRGPGIMVSLTFKTDSATWNVMVGPQEVVSKGGLTLAVGDVLSIVGAPVNGPGGTAFMARQITKDGTTLALLDAQGRPTGMPGGGGQRPD
jgi:hypothetical protein